jgi:AraC-like DNA-binding protein
MPGRNVQSRSYSVLKRIKDSISYLFILNYAMKIYVKNMACESCKIFVKEVLDELHITSVKVGLGEIETKGDVTDEDKKKINAKIKIAGLELIEKKNGVLIEKIRAVIIDYVYKSEEQPNSKFSILLSEKLNHDYVYLANFFSEIEATTIEQYLIALKIERIKELILFDELSLTEISYKLKYSSVGHLSNQFKKMTGLTPTHFKKLKARRLTIQEL